MTDHEISHPSSAKSSRKTKAHMPIKLDIPHPELMKPKITIFGVGGAGGNALNNMIRSNLEGVEFVAANTDSQALTHSLTSDRIQLGVKTTKGLGAGSFPDRGKIAAEENIEEIEKYLEGCHMVFIAAGMGGGTGTGAAPVIAKLAREREILTVGVVTKPFHFEGKYRMETAEAGIEELKKHVDTLIIIPNQNLFRIANENTTFESAFKMADDVLHAGVRGVTDLITMPGLVNLDFADIRTIMTKMGKAMMGTGEATGDNRAVLACEAAIANPLLDDISIKGAKGVLVNMTGGPDMTLFEADIAVNTIRKEVDTNANIIFGSAFDENMKGKIRISVVATGIDSEEFRRENSKPKEVNEPSRFRAFVSEGSSQNNSRGFFDPGLSAKPSKNEIEEINDQNFSTKKSFSKEENLNYGKESEFNHLKDNKKDKHFSANTNFFEDADNNANADFEDDKDDHSNGSESHSIEGLKSKNKENNHSNHREVNKKNHDKTEYGISENKKISKTTKIQEKSKKESSGFSLFSFMNKDKNETSFEQQAVGKNIFSEVDDIGEDFSTKEISKTKRPAKNLSKDSSRDFHNEFTDEENSYNHAKSKSTQEAEKKRKQFFGDTVFDDDDNDNEPSVQEKFDDIINVPAFFRRKK